MWKQQVRTNSATLFGHYSGDLFGRGGVIGLGEVGDQVCSGDVQHRPQMASSKSHIAKQIRTRRGHLFNAWGGAFLFLS